MVVEQEINRTEVILNIIQNRRTRPLSRDSEAVPVPIEVATVAMPEVGVNEEEIEIIQHRHTMQMLIFAKTQALIIKRLKSGWNVPLKLQAHNNNSYRNLC